MEKPAEKNFITRYIIVIIALLCILAYFNFKSSNDVVKYEKELAELGDAHYQFRMGLRYYYGNGVEQDFKKSTKYLNKAANQNNIAAINTLFFIALKNNEAEQAARYISKATDLGDSTPLVALSVMFLRQQNLFHFTKIPDPKNPVKQIDISTENKFLDWYFSNQGDHAPLLLLAHKLVDDFCFIDNSASNLCSYKDSSYNLMLYYLMKPKESRPFDQQEKTKFSVSPKIKKLRYFLASELFRSAALRGDEKLLFNLGIMHYLNNEPYIEHDYKKTAQYLQILAKKENLASIAILTHLHALMPTIVEDPFGFIKNEQIKEKIADFFYKEGSSYIQSISFGRPMCDLYSRTGCQDRYKVAIHLLSLSSKLGNKYASSLIDEHKRQKKNICKLCPSKS